MSGTMALDYCNGEMANCLAVVDEQAERIAELERREALLTANVIACERRRSYRAPKPPMSMNDAEVRAWSLEEAAIDLAMVNTYIALTEAGFPW